MRWLGRGVVALALCTGSDARAQERPSFEVAVHVAAASGGELDAEEIGIGGRVAWRPLPSVGAEAELTVYPSDLPDRLPATKSRIEALFGVTVGPALGPVRPFARVRSGVLRVAEAPAPIVCIAIFPPPVDCLLAAGHTLAMVDVGGGLELSPRGRAFVRVDMGDRLVRYPGPTFARGRSRERRYWVHDLRVALGAGLRF